MTNGSETLIDAHVGRSDRDDHESRGVLAALDERLGNMLRAVKTLEIWKRLNDPSSSEQEIFELCREVFLSVWMYQRDTTEASFHWLGRMPKTEERLLRALMNHKIEEAGHAQWARRDYLALGGDPARLIEPPSPAAFAVASAWWRMATVEDPLGYLGAEYLFEALTMQLAKPLVERLLARALPVTGIGFIVEHATEDVKHTNLIAHCIRDAAARYPGSGSAMLRCYDYFAHVYPLPVWTEALKRGVIHD